MQKKAMIAQKIKRVQFQGIAKAPELAIYCKVNNFDNAVASAWG